VRFASPSTLVIGSGCTSIRRRITHPAWNLSVRHRSRLESVAEAIAGDLDFLRVDLYEVASEVWFGETTPYPDSGLCYFGPREVDYEWGDFWELPQL
jgi:hypothetical protein